jgi:hypothetical protein
LLLVA